MAVPIRVNPLSLEERIADLDATLKRLRSVGRREASPVPPSRFALPQH